MSVYQEMSSSIYEVSFFSPPTKPPRVSGILGCPPLASPLTPAPPRPLCCRGRGWNPRSRRPSCLPRSHSKRALCCVFIHSLLIRRLMESAGRISAGTGGKELWPKQRSPAPWSAETQGASNDTNRLKSIQWKSDPWKVHGAVTVTARGLERRGRGVSGGAGQPLDGAALG